MRKFRGLAVCLAAGALLALFQPASQAQAQEALPTPQIGAAIDAAHLDKITGWDFATGIGTVNAYNLVMKWNP